MNNFLLLGAIFVSLFTNGQTIDNYCAGSANPVFSTWTQLAPPDSYMRMVKKNGVYYLRSASEVYSSSTIDGPWTSLNFLSQTGISGNNSLRTLEVTSQDEILIATPANGMYLYSVGNWQPIGLSGTGTNGIFAAELQNSRLLVMRAGFLRDLYITDNQGINWTNVTNGNIDWFDCLITNSGAVLVCVGNGGFIRSQDNGNSFQDISSSIGTTKVNSLTEDCNGNIYAVADIGIFQSSNDGTSWNLISNVPINANNMNSLFSGFLVATEGFYVFNDISDQVFKTSNDLGNSWQDITDYPGDLSLITDISEIDGNIVVCGIDGIWAKTISFCSPTTSSETVTECDSYTWNTNGQTYTQSGQYTEVLTNTAGCDSTITIDLTITNSSSSSITETVCDTYTAPDGTVYTTTGNYTVVIPNTAGCDSTITIDLTVGNSSSSSLTLTECDTYTAPDGTTYTTTGNYTAVIPNTVGCDSTITIDLTITNSNSSSETVTECDAYTWSTNGQTYTQSGQYTSVLTNQVGCDSTVTLNLTITNSNTGSETVTECDSYTWNTNGQTYTQSGQYTEVLTNTAGCDSTVTLDLTITSVNNNISQLDDITLQSDVTNAQYQWVDCDEDFQPIIGETGQVFVANANGNYAVIVSENNCSDTSACITINKVGLDDINKNIFNVYPNPTSNSFTISSEKVINSEFKIIDSQGREVLTGSMNGQEHTIDISNLSKGVYSVVFDNTEYPVVSVIKE